MKFAAHWALYPKSYTVHRVPDGVRLIDMIDGDLTKEVWNHAAPWSAPFGDIQGKDGPIEPIPALTQFKALYDDSYLYIGAIIHPSPDIPATEAHFTHRNDPIFQKDSDFEVFIDVTGCNHQYKEFEINAINTSWNLLLDKPYTDGGMEHSGRIAKPGDPMFYDVQYQKTAVRILEGAVNNPEKGQALWSVEMAFAYKDLFVRIPGSDSASDQKAAASPRPPQLGDFWRINFSRVEKKGDINWTWQPQVVWKPDAHSFKGIIDMHAPDAFGYFQFAGGRHDEADQEPRRDPTWPLRLAAMNIYYAQRAFSEKNDRRFASTLGQLEPFINFSIVEPFEVHLFVDDQQYVALVRSVEESKVATVTQDRLLKIQEWQGDPQSTIAVTR